ncbi:MAG: hypothetical protein ACR2G4_14280 [Pyrinomonadaceae bacterium]
MKFVSIEPALGWRQIISEQREVELVMSEQREVELEVGRETQRGLITLSSWLPELLTLGVSYQGERAASVTLTREQVMQLQQALAEIGSSMEERESNDNQHGENLKLVA